MGSYVYVFVYVYVICISIAFLYALFPRFFVSSLRLFSWYL